jgi:WD40 repeat protein
MTTSEDDRARLFRASDGVEIAVLRDHGDDVLTGEWSRDGDWIVTGSADGTARVIPGSESALLSRLWGVTSYCLSSEKRVQMLGASEDSAWHGYKECLSHPGRGGGGGPR